MSNLTVSTISAPSTSGNQISVPAPNVLYAPGHVIQVVNTTIVTPTAQSVPASYTTYTNIPSFSATITPKSTSSKVFISVKWFGEFSVQGAIYNSVFNIKRNGTVISVPAGAPATTNSCGITSASISYEAADTSSTAEVAAFDFFDYPTSTSALSYQVCITSDSAHTLYTNRVVTAAAGGYEYGTSMITLMEIAA
jgi:hypothetical protein